MALVLLCIVIIANTTSPCRQVGSSMSRRTPVFCCFLPLLLYAPFFSLSLSCSGHIKPAAGPPRERPPAEPAGRPHTDFLIGIPVLFSIILSVCVFAFAFAFAFALFFPVCLLPANSPLVYFHVHHYLRIVVLVHSYMELCRCLHHCKQAGCRPCLTLTSTLRHILIFMSLTAA